MSKYTGVLVSLSLLLIGGTSAAEAAELSIYDIQSTTSDGDATVYNGQIHNVSGGVVTHVWHGFNDRVYLWDPAHPTWGAIVVKDGEGGALSNNVNVGDWVSFDSIYIDEYRGTTFLQYRTSFAPDVTFSVDSTGNPVPGPSLLTVVDVAYPPGHAVTEPYESMVVTLQNVTVGQMDLGKAADNYELLQGGNVAWAADYMNVDLDPGALYDSRVMPGAEFLSLTGIVEQYTKVEDDWDYYQVVTRSAADIVPEPGTMLLLAGGMLLVGRRRHRG